jgi:hypothetical protein
MVGKDELRNAITLNSVTVNAAWAVGRAFPPGTLGSLPGYCLGGMLGTDAGHSTAAAI